LVRGCSKEQYVTKPIRTCSSGGNSMTISISTW
jgi:hypothetical protein